MRRRNVADNHNVNTPNTVRTKLAKHTVPKLVEALDDAWLRRRVLEEAAAQIGAELISRIVEQHVPGAYQVVLTEDHSHDAPHAHLKTILARDGTPLLMGMGDEWHDLHWTSTVDEYVYDIYLIAPSVFVRNDNSQKYGYDFEPKNVHTHDSATETVSHEHEHESEHEHEDKVSAPHTHKIVARAATYVFFVSSEESVTL